MNEAEPFNMNEMTVAEIDLTVAEIDLTVAEIDLVWSSPWRIFVLDTLGAKVVAKCVHTGR